MEALQGTRSKVCVHGASLLMSRKREGNLILITNALSKKDQCYLCLQLPITVVTEAHRLFRAACGPGLRTKASSQLRTQCPECLPTEEILFSFSN